MKYPESLNTLIAHLKKMPGVGSRTAERFAFELMGWPQDEIQAFSKTLCEIQEKIPPCTNCGALTDQGTCQFCDPTLRDTSSLCIIASARDVYAVEQTKDYRGLYHVLEHLLSPLDGRHAEQIHLDRILKRIEESKTSEIIIALDSTLEGDTTALYLKNQLEHLNLSISRLAFGLPVGSSLETIDGGTLKRALQGRNQI